MVEAFDAGAQPAVHLGVGGGVEPAATDDEEGGEHASEHEGAEGGGDEHLGEGERGGAAPARSARGGGAWRRREPVSGWCRSSH